MSWGGSSQQHHLLVMCLGLRLFHPYNNPRKRGRYYPHCTHGKSDASVCLKPGLKPNHCTTLPPTSEDMKSREEGSGLSVACLPGLSMSVILAPKLRAGPSASSEAGPPSSQPVWPDGPRETWAVSALVSPALHTR